MRGVIVRVCVCVCVCVCVAHLAGVYRGFYLVVCVVGVGGCLCIGIPFFFPLSLPGAMVGGLLCWIKVAWHRATWCGMALYGVWVVG
ncbi:hypothetical protein CC80DRAFT_154130 [Byssothecium circinans]|uniref:Uncharacterized protein n=1 Tax=Byssothecium circinans TaxID=147558 RepID=A0A6A5UBL7_9PLEO|nr:hypothetical protein CC80DRAFT_154130 [Byssothecium circinans]